MSNYKVGDIVKLLTPDGMIVFEVLPNKGIKIIQTLMVVNDD